MKQEKLISRRDLITSATALAAAAAIMPRLFEAPDDAGNEFVIVNGWVLRRSETA